jgi:hypothetical protein
MVVIQSDDWGRVGIPDQAQIDELRQAGFCVGGSNWDYYGLESQDDLFSLRDTLLNIRDSIGGHPVFSAVFVMANADLKRLVESGYTDLSALPIGNGFPAPWCDDNLMAGYRELIADGVFEPALHGYVHFNSVFMLALAQTDSDAGRRVRALVSRNIPYLASLTPEINFALVRRTDGSEVFIDEHQQRDWVRKGVASFAETFGHLPVSTCAPGYRFNDITMNIWKENGIRIVHSGGGFLHRKHGLAVIARNIFFEPFCDTLAIENAIRQARQAVACGEPLVISSHSINYISRHLRFAEHGRTSLKNLLHSLLHEFPNLRFVTEATLVETWENQDPTVWRKASFREKKNRFLI